MAVPMTVDKVVVAVGVGVKGARGCAERVLDPTERPSEVQQAEKRQHQGHGELHGQAEPGRDDQAKKDDRAADREDGEGVAHSPQGPDPGRRPDPPMSNDDCANSDDVISIRGMAHP